jgi:hypothetical protein
MSEAAIIEANEYFTFLEASGKTPIPNDIRSDAAKCYASFIDFRNNYQGEDKNVMYREILINHDALEKILGADLNEHLFGTKGDIDSLFNQANCSC